MPNIVGFLVAAIIAIVINAIYLFAILPQAHDFEMLVLAFAPVFLILGALASYNADFPTYVNGSAAAIVGVAATAIIISIFRSVSAE